DLATAVAARFPTINAFLANKWYLDDINDKLFVQGSRKLARSVLEVDSKVVDGVVNLTGLMTLGSGRPLSPARRTPGGSEALLSSPSRARPLAPPGATTDCVTPPTWPGANRQVFLHSSHWTACIRGLSLAEHLDPVPDRGRTADPVRARQGRRAPGALVRSGHRAHHLPAHGGWLPERL
ncbi:MAG: hypothetical protein ACKOPS_03425, partial [Cyanobium sp.]